MATIANLNSLLAQYASTSTEGAGRDASAGTEDLHEGGLFLKLLAGLAETGEAVSEVPSGDDAVADGTTLVAGMATTEPLQAAASKPRGVKGRVEAVAPRIENDESPTAGSPLIAAFPGVPLPVEAVVAKAEAVDSVEALASPSDPEFAPAPVSMNIAENSELSEPQPGATSGRDASTQPEAQCDAESPSLDAPMPPVPPPSEVSEPMPTTSPEMATASTPKTQRAESPSTRDATEQSPATRKSSGKVVAQLLALSGQMPHIVEATAPVEAPQQSVRLAEGDSAPELSLPHAPTGEAFRGRTGSDDARGAGTEVRTVDTGTADRGEVAFALRVRCGDTPEVNEACEIANPIAARLAPEQPRAPQPSTEGRQSHAMEPGENHADDSHASTDPIPASTPVRATGRDTRERRNAASAPEHSPSENPVVPEAPQAGAKFQPHAISAPTRNAETAAPPETAETTVKPPAVLEPDARLEPEKSGAVREVKFEITGQEHRVEVRLSERAGELKLTVRTPDAPLAGALRENLPALSARLTENGLKSESWHPPATSEIGETRNRESTQTNTSQDGNERQRQPQDRESQGGDPRRQRTTPEPIVPKQKGKDFAWLISSLR